MDKIKKAFLHILSSGKSEKACPWSLVDVAIITGLLALIVIKDPFGIGLSIVRFLRLHFYIFTKEPKLLSYLSISINAIIFKIVFIIFIILAVKARAVPFGKSVLSKGNVPRSLYKWIPLYIGVCALLRLVEMSNPLAPSIPFASVFSEAAIAGNIIIIFSIVILAPLLEEISFRGFLFPALNRRMGIYPAIVITSVLFTLAHYPQIKGDFTIMAIIFSFSLVITYARAKTGSTWLAIFMHHVYNLVYVVVGFLYFLTLR